MNVLELKNHELELDLKVVIPSSEIQKKLDIELSKLAKKSKIDGFRAGKVPIEILKRRYLTSLRADVINNTVQQAVKDIVDARNIQITKSPEILDLVNNEGQDLEFRIQFELLPEVLMPDFKQITLKKHLVKFNDEDIQEQMNLISRYYATYTLSEDTSSKFDKIIVNDFPYLSDNGVLIESAVLKEQEIVIGDNSFPEEFDNALLNLKAGNKIDLKLQIAEDHPVAELAGKFVRHEVEVLKLYKANIPNLDNEFVQKLGYDNLENFRKLLVKNMETVAQDVSYLVMKVDLFNKLDEELKFLVPNSILQNELLKITKQRQTDIENNKKRLESIFYTTKQAKDVNSIFVAQNIAQNSIEKLENLSEEEPNKEYMKLAYRRVRIALMLSEYLKVNNMLLEKSDISNALLEEVKKFPGMEKQVLEHYKHNGAAMQSLKHNLVEDKAVRSIINNAIVVVEVESTVSDLTEILSNFNIL
ncbi:trigger factor [Rickettsia endosymbiont of Cardiosporidium cionae]|uniref:trigger factor n=1 Tax=Rickettsia endosymbiont of Cardiosporidium cionae TaxID=2777155 RepID=UPI0018949106|nr:trigger factor [Rickettsia endosymbiont of Cardiosporidium cionae]KAF8818167.1 trigger factor [Rickettsia endosymbiont of Cardiosporidium cionae]